jgi:hypothetical protein
MADSTGRTDFGRQTTLEHGGRADHTEGRIARTIEEQTAKLPSDLFLWAAGASIVGSLALQFNGRKAESLFVGQWAPTFLILGLYNKLVKVAGSDAYHPG